MSRRKQFAETYRMAKKSDPRLGLYILGAFLVAAAVGFAIFWFLPGDGVRSAWSSRSSARCSSAPWPR